MIKLVLLLIRQKRGGRSIAPQDELHHFLGHDRREAPKDSQGRRRTFGHGSSAVFLVYRSRNIPPKIPVETPAGRAIENGDF